MNSDMQGRGGADIMNTKTLKVQKSQIRREVLEARMQLSEQSCCQKSLEICSLLDTSGLLLTVRTVFCYKSFKNEVNTEPIIELLRTRGITVCYPRIEIEPMTVGDETQHRTMNLYQADQAGNTEEDFELGAYGIREPNPMHCRKVLPTAVDLVLVPGVAFDRSMNRLGYGGGYYDRFFPKTQETCIRVALAFELQLVNSIPVDPYDTVMDYLITEKKVYTGSK